MLIGRSLLRAVRRSRSSARSLVKRNLDALRLHRMSRKGYPRLLGVASPQAMVRELHSSLTETQKREICLPWDYCDPVRGLVRSFIANHWQVTRPVVRSHFFSEAQQYLIFQIYLALLNPAWRDRFLRQLSDDTHGHAWGRDQSVAIFGDPQSGPFQFNFTGRHITLRVDGDPQGAVAFGGPIVYAHAASGYFEKPHHPGNIFWSQALQAARLHDALTDAQRQVAVVDQLPEEGDIRFAQPRGLPATALDARQRSLLEELLSCVLEPFRAEDQAQVRSCLARNGGSERLSIAYGRAHRMSAPAWDDWRLEGPAFIWHFRGWPHVHVWVHVAAHPGVESNARIGTFIFPGHATLE